MFQELQTCSDVYNFLEKDGMCVDAGSRVPEEWFYTARPCRGEVHKVIVI